MSNSLVLEKINYAREKKAEICEILGLSGNPTWDVIKAKISQVNADSEKLAGVNRVYDLTWEEKTWNYQVSNPRTIKADYIYRFKDGLVVYLEYAGSGSSGTQYAFYLDGDTWKDWNCPTLPYKCNAQDLFFDGTDDVYYGTMELTHYYTYENGVFTSHDREADTGVEARRITGRNMWKCGVGIFFADMYNSTQLIYRLETRTIDDVEHKVWTSINFATPPADIYGSKVFVVANTPMYSTVVNNQLKSFMIVYITNGNYMDFGYVSFATKHFINNEYSYSVVQFEGEDVYTTDYPTYDRFGNLVYELYLCDGTNMISFNYTYHDTVNLVQRVPCYDKFWDESSYNGSSPSKLRSKYFWTDGNDLYCSYIDQINYVARHYKLVKQERTKTQLTALVQYNADNIDVSLL